jgi:hypothetical protein
MPGRNPLTLIIGAALALTAPSMVASAAPLQSPPSKPAPAKRAKPAPPAKSKLDLPALQKALESGDQAQSLAGLETIAKSGVARGAPLVED